MLKRIILVSAVLMIVAASWATMAAEAAPYRCGAEDDASWAWSRCGNHKRGVTDLRTGRKVVVGVCGYAKLERNGNAGGPRLRGDWWAINHAEALGCNVVPTDINREVVPEGCDGRCEPAPDVCRNGICERPDGTLYRP